MSEEQLSADDGHTEDRSETHMSAELETSEYRHNEYPPAGSGKTAIHCFIVLCVTVVVLRSMGRSWWCDCGSLVPWSWDIWSSHNSQHFIDPYFFTHVLHGVLFFWGLSLLMSGVPARNRMLIAVTMESAWEILENSSMIIERYRAATISLDYFGDSIVNSLFDILAMAIGYWLASSVRWWGSLLIFAALELMLLITIRDCLTLNIIMLVSPMEAIKQWQVR
jgi:hypothetical protein